MKKLRLFVYCSTFAALVATGFVLKSDPANAQQPGEEQTNQVIDEIIEVGAPIERQQVGPTDAAGMRTEIIELKRQVSYADLDLTKHSDVIELEKRVEISAKESCEKLEEMYPFPPSGLAGIRRCTKKAIENSEEGIQAAIAAAQ